MWEIQTAWNHKCLLTFTTTKVVHLKLLLIWWLRHFLKRWGDFVAGNRYLLFDIEQRNTILWCRWDVKKIFFYSEKMRFFFPQTALNGNSYLKGTLGFGADGKGWSVSLNTPLEKVLGRLFVNLNWKCINNKILFNIYYKVNVADFWRFEKKHFTLKTKCNIVV